jgi:molybdate transport system substrate-binding protein
MPIACGPAGLPGTIAGAMIVCMHRQDTVTPPANAGVPMAGAALVFLTLAAAACAAPAPAPRVAAASDLQFALTAVAERFAAESGERVELVFGSSGTLARQIQDGAPFDLFLSADETFVEGLTRAGLTRDGGVLYATGRLALFAPPGSPLVPAEGFEGLRTLVATGQVRRFALANPDHAPYGRAAEQALRTHGLWEALRPSLVLGDNVSQAAQFAATGNAVGGLIAYSLVLAPAMQGRGTYALVPEEDHAPLRQRMVLLSRAGAVAGQFYDYLQQPAARDVFEQYGFALPR